MATAGQVIKAMLNQLVSQGAANPWGADEYADAIFIMNNYMLDLDASGIALGYTVVSTTSDIITIPTGALRGLIYNVAIELSSEYGRDVKSGVVRAAQEGLNTMRKLAIKIGDTEYPSTLPRGTGNWEWNYTSLYYPDLEAQILAETTGSISLESSTP